MLSCVGVLGILRGADSLAGIIGFAGFMGLFVSLALRSVQSSEDEMRDQQRDGRSLTFAFVLLRRVDSQVAGSPHQQT